MMTASVRACVGAATLLGVCVAMPAWGAEPKEERWDPFKGVEDRIDVRMSRDLAPPSPAQPVRITFPPNRFKLEFPRRGKRPPTTRGITKADYLKFLKKEVRHYLKVRVTGMGKQPSSAGAMYGVLAAYMYRETKDRFYADFARNALTSAIMYIETTDKFFPWVHNRYLMVDLMRETGLIAKKHEAKIREYLLTASRRSCEGHYNWKKQPWRRGSMHSALGPALARYYAVVKFPDIPEAELFTKYYNLTWGDWWTHRDTVYNDTGYRALLLLNIFIGAYLTERDDLFADPEAMKFWERILYTIAPNGAVPHFGDAGNWSASTAEYLFMMEYLAAKTRDGRFKYVAHRLFDHIVNHAVDVQDYHFVTDNILLGVAFAHMVADDTVKPVSLGDRSRVVTRKEILLPPVETVKPEMGTYASQAYLGYDRKRKKLRHAVEMSGPRDVPDKIAFRSSGKDEGLWALVDLCNIAGHNDVPEPTNVAALVDKEAVLGCNLGYYDEDAWFHNVVYAEDLEGHAFKAHRPMTISLRAFYDRARTSYARVHVKGYHMLPLDEERQFLFLRDRFLLLKDVVTFTDNWTCRIGPCWQTQQIDQVGKNWANTYIDYLFVSGMNVGAGIHRWKQSTRDLLVFHPPQKECALELVNRRTAKPSANQSADAITWRHLPLRLRYVRKVRTRKGMKMHWTTLLIPHAPALKAGKIVADIKVFADSPELTAIRVGKAAGEQQWVVLNDTGRAVTAGPLRTDAAQVHLSIVGTKRHLMAEGGTFVTFHGKELARVAKGEPVDKDF